MEWSQCTDSTERACVEREGSFQSVCLVLQAVHLSSAVCTVLAYWREKEWPSSGIAHGQASVSSLLESIQIQHAQP
jgi:hypothetical protein